LTGLFNRGPRKPDPPAPASHASSTDLVTTSKVFPRFLSAVVQQTAPVLLDLGPVVGSNITFFGERLACKIYVEDLVAEVEAHAKKAETATLAQKLDARLKHAPDSVDGILCWDLFDFLDRPTGQALAGRLARLLRKGGALYGLFGSTQADLTAYTRFVVEAEDRLRWRPYPATRTRRTVLVTRDIIKMFDGLTVTESVLLKSNIREVLFKKT
jgi:hypothetical protein